MPWRNILRATIGPQPPCEADAANCDICIGIFALRYGYIRGEDNPEGKSITELEYLAAGRAKKPHMQTPSYTVSMNRHTGERKCASANRQLNSASKSCPSRQRENDS
jgi:hypothetical protein